MLQSSEMPESIQNVPDSLWTAFLGTLADLPLGLALLDAGGHFRFINHALAETHGLPVEDHVGRHLADVLPDHWETAALVLERVRNGEFVARERSGETPAAPGVIRQWAEQWSPVRDEHGDVAGVALTVTEITEQKHAEEELQRVADGRDRLIGIISHELRGPLASVLGFAQRLDRHQGGLDARGREEVDIIYRQALEMRDRLEVLEAMSEQQGLTSRAIRSEALDLGVLLRDELHALQSRYPDIRFECSGDANVSTDPRFVREILSNLLDNAAKYGGTHGVVEVRVARTLSGAVIEVHDRGPGIKAEWQDRLFEPGFRTKEATESNTDGDGLGLYISNQLALQLGGRLSLLSIPGDGASFFLHLPWESARDERRSE